MIQALRAEWIRIRRHWVAWLSLATDVAYLIWQLHSDMVARGPVSVTSREWTGFYSSEYVIPYVLTWLSTPYLFRAGIWAATGALWSWNDWRPSMPSEHLVRFRHATRTWVFTRLISLLALSCLTQVAGVIVAIFIGVFHGFWPSGSHLLLCIRVATSGILFAWTMGVMGLAFMALWSNFALGALSAWTAWWLHFTTEPRILNAITLFISPTLSWILAAASPFDNLSVLTQTMFTWGTSLAARGWPTTYPFTDASHIGVYLGSSASTHWILMRYLPTSFAACVLLGAELALCIAFAAWTFGKVGRAEPKHLVRQDVRAEVDA